MTWLTVQDVNPHRANLQRLEEFFFFFFASRYLKNSGKIQGNHQANRTQISGATHDKEYTLCKTSLEKPLTKQNTTKNKLHQQNTGRGEILIVTL